MNIVVKKVALPISVRGCAVLSSGGAYTILSTKIYLMTNKTPLTNTNTTTLEMTILTVLRTYELLRGGVKNAKRKAKL